MIREFLYGKEEEEKKKEKKKEIYIKIRYEDTLHKILDKRFNNLFIKDYMRVRYIIKNLSDEYLKCLAYMPEDKFFGRYFIDIKEDLEEFRRQVLCGRISKYTHDLLKYVAMCNISYYPNGRYNSDYEADECIDRGCYKLEKIKKNLLEG